MAEFTPLCEMTAGLFFFCFLFSARINVSPLICRPGVKLADYRPSCLCGRKNCSAAFPLISGDNVNYARLTPRTPTRSDYRRVSAAHSTFAPWSRGRHNATRLYVNTAATRGVINSAQPGVGARRFSRDTFSSAAVITSIHYMPKQMCR